MATRIETPYTQRARYYSSLDGFNIQKPPVPAHVFVAERDRAFDPSTPTGLVPCDLSRTLGIGFPATAPLVLARYAKIRAGERLTTRFQASGALYYVIAGSGESAQGADTIAWDAGDAFCLPGGFETVHTAGSADSLLYVVTNEPLLAFELQGVLVGVGITLAVQHDLAAERAHRVDFEARRRHRHHDQRAAAEPARAQRHTLRMVARRRADHAALQLLGAELRHLVVGTAQLEAEDRLGVLALEQHVVAEPARQAARRLEG